MPEPKKKSLLEMLGIGMARDAGESLAGRKDQIDKAVDGPTGPADPEVDKKKSKKLSQQLGIY